MVDTKSRIMGLWGVGVLDISTIPQNHKDLRAIQLLLCKRLANQKRRLRMTNPTFFKKASFQEADTSSIGWTRAATRYSRRILRSRVRAALCFMRFFMVVTM